MALPATALLAIQRAVRIESGPIAAVQAMSTAGYRAGEGLGEEVLQAARDGTGRVGRRAFWRTLGEHLSTRGWGRIEHESLHPGVGLLASPDWAEAEGEGEIRPSCAFSAGLFSAILSGVAGGPVAVLETECRARGDARCTFVFGAEATVQALHGELLEGADLPDALDALESRVS